MKNLKSIAAQLNNMTEEERIDMLGSELTFQDIINLYDYYGFVTEISDGKITGSYLESSEADLAGKYSA